MNTTPLTPGLSTHFRWLGNPWILTPGKIYKILKWEGDTYFFLDDTGKENTWCGQYRVVDASYETNLKKVLE